ncbi:hypothetical protein FNV43_RR21488 [Rhamnella rubrinervis]|uniref:Disease resistance protein At4g27190-like leucine-rich repeats domain-containing protein n=1 Tax=Rhamnella rubrinervis TaxID=2594499 RepID=A0A8K0E380_9ROSA|nr:hypothetical protein FNV43_RR21488 [Rhamnella rubrinervis]
MRSQRNFVIQVLAEQEAWKLFEEVAGTSINNPDLRPIAKQIVKECRGLPVAIVTVGRALENKNKEEWKDALRQLRKSIAENISDMNANKTMIFLLKLWLDLGKDYGCFKALKQWKKPSSVESLVQTLKRCFLLLDSNKEDCVKMHDIVRDVAISIASKKEHGFVVRCDNEIEEWPEMDRREDCTRFSLVTNKIKKSLDSLRCPNLKLLHLSTTLLDRQEFNENFCTEMKELKLEILSLVGSDIQELPMELRHLQHLKLLDLTDCKKLKQIQPGVLSSLTRLEELYMRHSFSGWSPVQGNKEKSSACLDELIPLSDRLKVLDVYVPEVQLLPQNFVLKNLTRFRICICFDRWTVSRSYLFENILCFEGNTDALIKSGINLLLNKCEKLELRGLYVNFNRLSGVRFSMLKIFKLYEFWAVKYLIDLNSNWSDDVPFPVLEELITSTTANSGCNTLSEDTGIVYKETWEDDHNIADDMIVFPVLTTLTLSFLQQLISLYSSHELSYNKGGFDFHGLAIPLPEKEIENSKLVGVHEKEKEEEDQRPWCLKWIPTRVDKSVQGNNTTTTSSHSNAQGEVRSAATDDGLVREPQYPGNYNINGVPQQLVFKSGFQNLTTLHVEGCHKLTNIFSPSIAKLLEKLERIEIEFCEALQVIVAKEEEEENVKDGSISFPCLRSISIKKLGDLSCFSDQPNCAFRFPSLERY